MTELEKRDAEMFYDGNFDKELADHRDRAKELCFAFNQMPPSHKDARAPLLRALLGKTGERFLIEPSFFCDYGYNIELGEDFYMNHNCVILDCAKVIFGDFVFVAPMCGFYTAGHPLDAGRRNVGLEYAWPITVGNHVWIGAQTAVMPGVTIGDGTVIGGGSVVTRDIPSGVLAAGNPCRVIRPITAADREKYQR